MEATVEATVASAAEETARRKSTRKEVVYAMLRTANLEESDRRRAVRACAPLHENDSDTHSDVAHPWAHRPVVAEATWGVHSCRWRAALPSLTARRARLSRGW